MFFYIVLTPIYATSGLWSTGNTSKSTYTFTSVITIDVLYFHWFPPHYLDAYPSIEFSIIIMGTYPSMKFILIIRGAYHCIDFYIIIMDVLPFHWRLHHYDIPHCVDAYPSIVSASWSWVLIHLITIRAGTTIDFCIIIMGAYLYFKLIIMDDLQPHCVQSYNHGCIPFRRFLYHNHRCSNVTLIYALKSWMLYHSIGCSLQIIGSLSFHRFCLTIMGALPSIAFNWFLHHNHESSTLPLRSGS